MLHAECGDFTPPQLLGVWQTGDNNLCSEVVYKKKTMLERILVFLVICLAKNISSISLFIIPYDGEPVVY